MKKESLSKSKKATTVAKKEENVPVSSNTIGEIINKEVFGEIALNAMHESIKSKAKWENVQIKERPKFIQLKSCMLSEKEFGSLQEYFHLFKISVSAKKLIISGERFNIPGMITVYSNPSIFVPIEGQEKDLRFYVQKELSVLFLVYGNKKEEISSYLEHYQDLSNRKGKEQAKKIYLNGRGLFAPFPSIILERESKAYASC